MNHDTLRMNNTVLIIPYDTCLETLFQVAAQAKKEILVLKPEILDQRKILDKGETALSGGQWAEALRLFKKADRIYSDNRSKGAIQKVEELLEEHERKLAEEKKEKEIQRQKYLNMTDDDRQLGMWLYREPCLLGPWTIGPWFELNIRKWSL